MGFPAVYCDVERSITKNFLEMRGVDVSSNMLDVIQMQTGEEYIMAIKEYLDYGEHKVIVIDSIAAMLSNREDKMALDKEPMGAGGLLTSRMTRVLTAANKSNASLIMVNQTRQKLNSFGDNTTKPGGKAPSFYAGQILRLVKIENKRQGKIGDDRRLIYQRIAAILEKDKTSGNMGKESTIYYDNIKNSVNYEQEVLAYGLISGLIQRSGNTYTFRKKRVFKESDT